MPRWRELGLARHVGDDGRNVPAHLGTVAGDHGVDVVGERAVEVLGNTAASDVGNGVHRSAAAQQLQNRLDVDARGSQQGVCQRSTAELLERTAQLLRLSGGLGRAA